ncbi:MAG: class I SAM-dependent methyltransferase [Novosphingobium sp.]|jgi:SAM-dependent methyltransferase|nr:class I SAM-dependent methyltransferase [Novosphingobium sp.]
MKQFLKHPAIYQLYQEVGGFFAARIRAIRDYLEIRPGARIIDIGCGPGHIVRHLPRGIDYIGLDIDRPSIDYASARFGNCGCFQMRFFDAAAVDELGPVDIVMMNGVMHHIGDADLEATLVNAKAALKPHGVLFTLDGCYVAGQSWIDKWLLDNDRSAHVRDEAGYRRLLGRVFGRVDMYIRDDYSRLPYTFAIGVARGDRV